MKKFLVYVVSATMLCSCSPDQAVFESCKGWVAMKTCSYDLLEEFKKEYDCKGDLSSLFYEQGEVEMSYLNGSPSKFTSNLNDLAGSLYKALEDVVYYKYQENVEDGIYEDDNDIIMNIIQEYKSESLDQRESDDAYFYKGPFWAPTKFDGRDIYYNVDWLFRNESKLKTLSNDLLGICGKYNDFYDFVMNSVSVLDSEWIENIAGSDVYDVIYQIDAGDSTEYALCKILVNEENIEIQLINSSDTLMDLY